MDNAEQVIADIRARTDLVALISQTVPLRKIGAIYKGLCPFHDDRKTPSLTVDNDKGLWHCYGCNKWGDAVQWVRNRDNLDFAAAVDLLSGAALKAGTPRPPAVLAKKGVPLKAKETVYDIIDTKGRLIAQHVRQDLPDGTKRFQWRRDGQMTLNGLKPAALPLYGMAHLIKAAPGESVILCEGEKAAQSLIDRGHLAMGTVCGAATTPDKDVLTPLLGSEQVYLWPDNDPSGYGHMTGIARVLLDIGVRDVWLVRWPEAPPKGDAADFHGDVNALLQSAERFQTEAIEPGTPGLITVEDGSAERRIPLIGGNALRIIADNVRRERTGIHGRISLRLDDQLLAHDVFNIERAEERLRLSKQAFTQLPEGVDNLLSVDLIRSYLDHFTMEVWAAIVGADGDCECSCSEELFNSRTEFFARPFVLEEGGMIMFAPPGTGKSYMAMLMAVAIDSGIQTLWPIQRGRVLWINLERSPSSVVKRLGAINRALGLPLSRKLIMLHKRGFSMADVIEPARRIIREQGINIVFLDSISRTGVGDLNENVTANRTIDTLSRLTPCWFALAHSPRSDDGHAYGSVHFDAGADMMIRLRQVQKTNELGIELAITKSNDTPKDTRYYRLAFLGPNLDSAEQADPDDYPEFFMPKLEGEPRGSPAEDMIRTYLLEHGEASINDISMATGLSYSHIGNCLVTLDSATKTRKDGRRQLWGLQQVNPTLNLDTGSETELLANS